MVTNAYAVVHPRAMVIHLDNASSAHAAVMGSNWLECLASFTELAVWVLCDACNKLGFRILFLKI